MKQETKHMLYTHAKKHVQQCIAQICDAIKKTDEAESKERKALLELGMTDKLVQEKLIAMNKQKKEELETLKDSPYFARCMVSFNDTTEKDELYFGKFSFPEEHIYSWITPAASLRFEHPGEVSYVRPDEQRRSGTLEQKQQYMITNGNIVFQSIEGINQPRELVYQEYFSKQKTGFMLPEIVAQMEKAQDTVIRAHYKGPLVISGPAGSGKTTLALHRVAYLMQSPGIADKFKTSTSIVFVQDASTKAYFSALLPELGIKGVTITTFAEWAMSILDLKNVTYQSRIGNSEKEKDIYERKKQNALSRNVPFHKSIFKILQETYDGQFSNAEKTLFEYQKKNSILDRFDLTILIKAFKQKHNRISVMKEYYKQNKTGAADKKIGRFAVDYSLMIVDEFQNYLPEQLQLMRSALNADNNAIMYVGDMAQQTQLGTIQEWSQINERIQKERQIMLHKVYRNTKQILEYIRALGYKVEIPEQVAEGKEVIEKACSKEDEQTYIDKIIKDSPNKQIAILAKDQTDVEAYNYTDTNVHVMTMAEAQGLEFDIVCIVGITKETFSIDTTDDDYATFREEKKRVNKDLLYVALTRAMSELYVFGRKIPKNMV